MTMTDNGFIESEERQALRKAVAGDGRQLRPGLLPGEGRARPAHRRIVAGDRQTRLHRRQPARGVRRRRRGHVRAVHRDGGDVGRRLPAAADGRLPRHQRHDHQQVRHRRAEEAVAARHRRRLDHDGVRDHRTRRGLELAPHHHHRPPRRQRLGSQRPEGVHLRRRPGAGGARRGPHRGGQDRQPAARAVHRAHRYTRLHLDQDRDGDSSAPRTSSRSSSTTSGCRPTRWWAPRTPRSPSCSRA